MKKKTVWILLICSIVAIVSVAGILIIKGAMDKKEPVETYAEEGTGEDKASQAKSEDGTSEDEKLQAEEDGAGEDEELQADVEPVALYVKDDKVYGISLNGGEPWMVSSEMEVDDFKRFDPLQTGTLLRQNGMLSKNGRWFLWLNGKEKSVYYADLGNPGKTAVKIDANVETRDPFDKGSSVIYLTEKGDLCQFDLKKETKTKIASDVRDYCASKDGNVVAYVIDTAFFLWDGKTSEKLAEGAKAGLEGIVKNKVYFTEKGNFYEKKPGEEKKKIDDEVHYVIAAYENDAYYEKITDGSKKLYHYDGTKSEMIMDRFMNAFEVHQTLPMILFFAWDEQEERKKQLLAVGNEVSELKQEELYGAEVLFQNDGKAIYYFPEDSLGGKSLRRITVADGKPGQEEMIAKKAEPFYAWMNEDDQICYVNNYAMRFSRTGDLCCGDATIDVNVCFGGDLYDEISYAEESKKFIYLKFFYNGTDRWLNLMTGNNGKTELIAENVLDFAVWDEGRILYIQKSGSEERSGDLYAYEDGKSVKLAEGVSNILNRD